MMKLFLECFHYYTDWLSLKGKVERLNMLDRKLLKLEDYGHFMYFTHVSLISHKDGLSNNCIDQKRAISEEIILKRK